MMNEQNKDIKREEEETGASMVEYALIAALVAVVCISAVTFLGQQASQAFSRIGSSLDASQ